MRLNKEKNRNNFKSTSRKYFILDFPVIIKFCLLLLIIGMVIFILRSDFFKITFIDCQKGEFMCSYEDMSLFREFLDKNIFLLSINDSVKDIQLKDLDLKGIRMTKKFPNRLVIRLEERKPAAVLVIKNENFQVDQSGFVFSSSVTEKKDLPIIFIETPQSVTLGTTVDENIKKSLELARALNDYFVHYEKLIVQKEALIIYSTDFIATLSASKDFPIQISSLQLILQSSKIKRPTDSLSGQEKKIIKIDLRFEKPVVFFDE